MPCRPRREARSPMPIVVGIDVGAPSKGYHAVALSKGTIAEKFQSSVPAEVAQWCIDRGAEVIAVDAPCRWRMHGGPARAAERELAASRISCFSTPTEEKARGHAFYTWMFAGQELYTALAATHLIYRGEAVSDYSGHSISNSHPLTGVAIETFPQAVACALAGELVSAKTKLAVRREVLIRAGVDVSGLEGIDEVDAALCALTAERFAQNRFKAYGDVSSGFVIVPSESVEGFNGAAFRPSARGTKQKTVASEGALGEVLAMLPHLSPSDRLALRSRLDDLSL